jgi:hypothetical protein
MELSPSCEHRQVTAPATEFQTPPQLEMLVAGFALAALLAAQWMLSAAIEGTNYYGFDGKMAQAIILTIFEFGSRFGINNLNPIEGVGSQLLPMNVWANPAYWPFAIFDKNLVQAGLQARGPRRHASPGGENRIARLALERRSPVPGLERYRRENSGRRACPQIAIATISAEGCLLAHSGTRNMGTFRQGRIDVSLRHNNTQGDCRDEPHR